MSGRAPSEPGGRDRAVRLDRPRLSHQSGGSRAALGDAAGGDQACRRAGDHGAHAQRLGTARRLVSPPRRARRAGAAGTVGGPACLLPQAHQERPHRLAPARETAAVAPGGAARRARPRAGAAPASRDPAAPDARQAANDVAGLTEEIAALEERIALQFEEADPQAILTSAPGVGAITGAQILGRLGDPNRFRSLAGVRSFSGLVPSLDASGVSGRHGGPTRAGDASLREAIFIAADHARRIDPTLAARYHRLMVTAGKHHNSTLCHVATALLTRIVACWRRGERYVIRDCDGRPVSVAEGRRIVAERYTVPAELRRSRRSGGGPRSRQRTGRRSQESQRAPTPSPSGRHATTSAVT